MLNNLTGKRELAYVVKIDQVMPIGGMDRIDYARVGGWWIVVRKGEFKVGDKAVYIEIDSNLPHREPFMHMEKHDFKVKTAKIGKVFSQGLLVSLESCGLDSAIDIGTFLTDQLEITYGDDTSDDIDLGLDEAYPFWIHKTDEERIENLPSYFSASPVDKWIATEKIDGTSATFGLLKDQNNGTYEYCICSHRKRIKLDSAKPDDQIYLQIGERYGIAEKLKELLEMKGSQCQFVIIQGEIYGKKIQKRNYDRDPDIMAFNLIYGFNDGSTTRLNPIELHEIIDKVNIPAVPIVDTEYTLPEDINALREFVHGASALDGKPREGIVFRSYDGDTSFKCVDPAYLMKY